jgi:phospholipid/cholesterol/gamma-HCH transport system ATP-binding protein
MNPVSIKNMDYQVSGKRILHQINLEVFSGEIFAVIGMSGSGKTTLLKCLAGLRKPSSGEISLFGNNIVPIPEYQLDKIRLKVGLVFQYAALFDSLSVFDNVAFGLVQNGMTKGKDLKAIVARRLREVDMEGSESMFPSELSGGMQKRVGLARALAMKPDLLLYDEPTSGLDPVIARTIDDLIVRTRDRSGVTSVVVSHDLASVFRIADRIAMLEAGEIIICGTPEEIKSSDNPKVAEFIHSA